MDMHESVAEIAGAEPVFLAPEAVRHCLHPFGEAVREEAGKDGRVEVERLGRFSCSPTDRPVFDGDADGDRGTLARPAADSSPSRAVAVALGTPPDKEADD